MSKYWCRWCGLEKDFEDRNYEFGLMLEENQRLAEFGLMLAENQGLAAFGHTEDVTPYLVCKKCAERIDEAFRIAEEEYGRNSRDANFG